MFFLVKRRDGKNKIKHTRKHSNGIILENINARKPAISSKVSMGEKHVKHHVEFTADVK